MNCPTVPPSSTPTTNPKIYVCGHRNPDVDSIASAYALADLRRKTLTSPIEPLCPGRLPERAAWVFQFFGVTPPITRGDVYVRVQDLIDPQVPTLLADTPLLEALKILEASHESSLPVISPDHQFLGMLSPIKLLSFFIEGKDLHVPVGQVPLSHHGTLAAQDRIHDIKATTIASPHNHFPVLDESGHFIGTLLKGAFAETPPFRMILVDHNETDQGIPGLEEIPVLEVVDHHRIAFHTTAEPIRYTADTVGSTCTLVTRLFRAAGLRPSKSTAGILLAGIVADTLLFQSPTTTQDDLTAATWLEKIANVASKTLMDGMLSITSVLNLLSPEKAIDSDRKSYHANGYHFSQIGRAHV